MGKVFTITEGLENMGALKTGGQGSVYKARRNGTTITAVKLLPTPIYSESGEDKNFTDFQNEVQKLRKVNEEANPHVVTILNSGITETGSFPFIEMEFIEGPDLEELLKPPHPPVFSIAEAIKVAKHISDAIAHCHKVGVKHGDIKTNNVKLNSRTDNYVLLDFGLAVMSDEQRRTSLRHAGAIEFMAPEQHEGQLLFQSDVYSFGIILFELLGGQVPFPLEEKGESARNHVMIAHMEEPLPDLQQLRLHNLPSDWPEVKKSAEAQIPTWLSNGIKKSLLKDPKDRFENGLALKEYIFENADKKDIIQAVPAIEADPVIELRDASSERIVVPPADKKIPPAVHTSLPKVEALQTARSKKKGLSVSAMLFLLLGVGAISFAAYSLLHKNSNVQGAAATTTIDTIPSDTFEQPSQSPWVKTPVMVKKQKREPPIQEKKEEGQVAEIAEPTPAKVTDTAVTKKPKTIVPNPEANAAPVGRYKVRSVAHFHNQPDESTRRAAFINHWNNAILKPTMERNGFVYIIFTNDEGQTSKGWLRLQDLIKLDD